MNQNVVPPPYRMHATGMIRSAIQSGPVSLSCSRMDTFDDDAIFTISRVT